MKLKLMVHTALWPAFRESNPATAITTLDDHLARMQWQDCYTEHCRTVLGSELTPYEIWTNCGPMFCPPDFPPELEAAVKRGIATALARSNMGVIKNLCGLNWIIEPLGASIRPIYTPQPTPPIYDECASMCEDIMFEVCPTSEWIDSVGSEDVCGEGPEKISAVWDRGCDKPAGLPETIWPGVLAAECIVRSMMPPTCTSYIKSCCA
jgi:hypothetical protein